MKYSYIKRKKHFLDPEEVLLDRKVKEAREKNLESLESPISPFLIRGFFAISLFLFLVIFSRVFYLQAIEGEYYQQRAEKNSTYHYIVNAPRGIIYDRFLEPLVFNSPSFSLVMIPSEMPQKDEERKELIDKVASVLKLDKEEIETLFQSRKYHYSLEPILIKSNLEVDEVRLFETVSQGNSGFNIISDYSRYYPFKDAFAHVLGYIGKISSQDIEKYKDYPLTSMVGKDGLEAYYENVLQGRPGQKIIEVDAVFNIQKSLGSIEPEKGKDIITTLDKDLQLVFYNSLRERIEEIGSTGGAGIALNPKTGEILSLISVPSFDPDLFTKGSPTELIDEYLQSPFLPLFNRAISGLYPPGSLIKLLMAVAALEENIIDPEQELFTEGKIVITSPYDPQEQWVFRDWDDHGWVNMKKAIAVSCNVYFWAVGGGWEDVVGLGLSKIKKYWLAFGLNEKIGIDLFGEADSVLPDTEWMKKNRPLDPTWKLGDTYSVSIGEGGFALTPLQMAAYIATIANDGVLMQPHLSKEESPEEKLRINVSSENLNIVQEGMKEVILSGTATYLNSLPFEMAGKSGSPKTYINGKEGYHTIFGAYAPYEDPQIVILVFIEAPPQNVVATLPVVKDVLGWYWENRINK
ncbi:MAG: penicillin-binding protein 2 [Candidatus Paceibacterota bacterium]|jgi:penicillin-binding protein 2